VNEIETIATNYNITRAAVVSILVQAYTEGLEPDAIEDLFDKLSKT
jgi:uncharacterized protein (DUF433 family)